MPRTRLVIFLGVLFVVGGALVLLNAPSLSTHWQRIGENAWGGTGDHAKERGYQWLGLSLLAFGLVATAIGLNRWIKAETPGPSDAVRQS